MSHLPQELLEGLLSQVAVDHQLADGQLISLEGKARSVLVGPTALAKVTTSVGCSQQSKFGREVEKLEQIAALGYRPDLIMDLSILRGQEPLYAHVREILGVPVGTLPHYIAMAPRSPGGVTRVFEEIEKHLEEGVSWITLHVSVTKEIYDIACEDRPTPMTSRGGGRIISEMLDGHHDEGLFLRHYAEVLALVRKHGAVLSLGSTFRPATTKDALDRAHVRELRLQVELARSAAAEGVPAMIEPLGHMTLGKISAFTELMRTELQFQGPLMTLGPIVTDAAVGEDHIANAIGASALGLSGGADIFNSITREEHTGKVPTDASILEGLRAARIAAHAVNISRFPQLDGDDDVNRRRAANYTCVVEGGLFTESARSRFAMGCSRCADECPLLVNRRVHLAEKGVTDRPRTRN